MENQTDAIVDPVFRHGLKWKVTQLSNFLSTPVFTFCMVLLFYMYDELGTGQSGHNLFGHQPYQFQITK